MALYSILPDADINCCKVQMVKVWTVLAFCGMQPVDLPEMSNVSMEWYALIRVNISLVRAWLLFLGNELLQAKQTM